eukprot:TRINITY_DN718_c0_g2_i1.p1 TRINITY_DN718_c0_g2~~TRINITY_DN718_c0_g2_i1.p1  ORF type:complete len:256 (+),score=66.90 TRINITY_DN718_c0_g2_i1:56-823(+)
MPHAPTKDVTTTETIEDKDGMTTKVTRDHDELGQHTHSEVVDKVTSRGRTHSEATDIEKDDGEHVHKEVVDRDGAHGEHIHQTVTKTDKGNRHVAKVCTDTDDEGGRHVHEEERTSSNQTLLGDGIVKRTVSDRDEPGHHHHEETTKIQKVIETTRAPMQDSVTQHITDDRDTADGTHIHEETDIMQVMGTLEKRHSIVSDKDIEGGHIHREKVETLKQVKGEAHAVVDEKVILTEGDTMTVDEIHKEAIVKDEE